MQNYGRKNNFLGQLQSVAKDFIEQKVMLDKGSRWTPGPLGKNGLVRNSVNQKIADDRKFG